MSGTILQLMFMEDSVLLSVAFGWLYKLAFLQKISESINFFLHHFFTRSLS